MFAPVSPEIHAAHASQRHADQLEQAARACLVSLARAARPRGTRGATSSGRWGRRPSCAGDVSGMVDELRGFWSRRPAGRFAAA